MKVVKVVVDAVKVVGVVVVVQVQVNDGAYLRTVSKSMGVYVKFPRYPDLLQACDWRPPE